MQGFINFPRQKLSDTQKTDEWYKKNLDFAEHILSSDKGLRNSFANKRTNYNLRANVINPTDFERFINPDQLDLTSLPASFQHIGIENTKLNLLIGEYSKRKHDFRAYLSANDRDGISRKEQKLKEEMDAMLMELIKNESVSEQEIQKRLEEFKQYQSYDYQDIAEITANKILKREVKEQNLGFTFLRTFEDLLVAGEQIVYCGVLGGEPVMRRVNTENLYTIGGNSMFIEDADIIVEYGYLSTGQVIDDYWDELKDEDVEFLENGTSASSSTAIGLNNDISVLDRFGSVDGLNIFHPSELGSRTFGGAFDTRGNVRVLKVCWRSRRKIGKLKYYDEDGEEQYDYVPEDYKPKKELGEEVKWVWVNEWLQGTKIADHVIVATGPVPFASKSMVNKSKGTPPYIGSVNSTNDYKVQSLSDIMKPLAYSYDIAYYKRELEIATYKGSFAAINASLVPSGWDPKEWIKYMTINKIGFLDPTNEILKGPSQGKSAGAFNTLTATNVNIGDPNAIQMYTNLLLSIEDTLGKVAGVSGAREGQIQNSQAVGNVEREVTQTSHITEKWFAIDSNFRKRALTKFLECCKYAYKENPKKGYMILNDMESVLVDSFDEFCMSEFDIHISNSTEDTNLYENLKQLSQAAIQNGQAKISDLIAISQSESVQEVGIRLEKSAKELQEQQEKLKQMDQQTAQQNNEAMAKQAEAQRMYESAEKEKDRAVKYAEIESKERLAMMSETGNHIRHTESNTTNESDTDNNGIGDYIDVRRTDIDEKYKQDNIRLQEQKLAEDMRKNRANEELKKKALSTKNKKTD
jgi:hypothetical protein